MKDRGDGSTSVRDAMARLVKERDLFCFGPEGVRAAGDSDDVHGHLLAPFILLATRDDVLARTFPPDGSVNPQAVYERRVDPDIVTVTDINKLRKYRAAFASLQVAWLELAGYQDPPCLRNDRMDALIDFTKTLSPKQK